MSNLTNHGNTVNWYTWDSETFSVAKSQNKPIFLFIGHVTCSLSTVMSQESFQDQTVAKIMNDHFINIKVDRDERPDLGRIYQLTHQILTRRLGGWPLSIFLDPVTLLPFFSGTYFQRRASSNTPGFSDLLLRISESFGKNKESVLQNNNNLASILNKLTNGRSQPKTIDTELTKSGIEKLEASYDVNNGGFGKAPKFSNPSALRYLLYRWANDRHFNKRNERKYLDMAISTLTKIGRSGSFDHVGGGFFSYSKLSDWNTPFFEKTIHLNAQLLGIFCEALKLGPDVLFEEIVKKTADWFIREMTGPDGAFLSTVADTYAGNTEGNFYLWNRNTVRRLLTDQEYLIIETLYGLDKPANLNTKWILNRRDSWDSVVRRLSLDIEQAKKLHQTAKTKLLVERGTRKPPIMDTKILTAWNGLVIRGLSEASIVLNEPRWFDAASSAADFIQANFLEGSKLFATSYKNLEHKGFLDDYANMIDGLLAMLSANWREKDASLAVLLADGLLEYFYDDVQGGFFFTSRNEENLVHKLKPTTDDILPPGNATAIRVLNDLGNLIGNSRYLEAAAKSLDWGRLYIERQPESHYELLQSLENACYPNEQIIIRGPRGLMQDWLKIARSNIKPWRKSYGIPYDEVSLTPSYLPRLASMDTQNKVTAYFCTNCSYSESITAIDEFKKALESS